MNAFIWAALAAVFLAMLAAGPRIFRLLRKSKKSKTCRECAYWDQPSGQRMLRQSPNFNEVMRSLSPNDEFGTKVFETGEDGVRFVKHRLPVFPPFEDSWEYFGGCQKDSVLRHRIDTCGNFKGRGNG